MQQKPSYLALLALLLSACGGVARKSSEESPASPARPASPASTSPGSSTTAGASGGPSANPDSAVGGAGSAGSAGSALAGAGGDISGAGGTGAPLPTHGALLCDKPTSRPHGGGYTECSDGSLRRASAAVCDSALPRAAADTPVVFDECMNDTDCTASPHGYCAYGACKYGCLSDDECPDSQACFCGEFVGSCVPADCRSDADCPADFPCTAYQEPGFAKPDALWCQSPLDECLTDAQCNSLNPRVTCKVQLDHRVCVLDPVE